MTHEQRQTVHKQHRCTERQKEQTAINSKYIKILHTDIWLFFLILLFIMYNNRVIILVSHGFTLHWYKFLNFVRLRTIGQILQMNILIYTA